LLVLIVPSRSLSAAFDAADDQSLVASYHTEVARLATEADGYVAQFLGDGVLLYFGYPSAREGDAERAVRRRH
jgi:hypothetical protein